MKSKMTVGRALLYVVLLVYAFITLYPFLWMVAASFKPLREIVGGSMALISENMTLDNYTTIFGVQGRYWLPVLPLALVLVHSNKNFCTRRSLGRGAVFAVACLTSLVILQGYALYASWQAVI